MRIFCAGVLLLLQGALHAATPVGDIGEEPHRYWRLPDNDPFTRFIAQVESGRVKLDASKGEKAFVEDLLTRLGIPASSQLWVFSGTSFQSGRISPANPRAVYFNEDLYVAYVPHGQLEIASLDPERGAIFYIFDFPREGRIPRFQRSDKCMNCHSGAAQLHVPGLAIESVLPGPNTGSLDAFRRGLSGHDVPLEKRFGGWHVTGAPALLKHHGNLVGQMGDDGITTTEILPGTQFNEDTFPVRTSDLLAHLVLEHQTGFINRVLEAQYLTRAALYAGKGTLSIADATALDAKADSLVKYILFAHEAPLPNGGIAGDSAYKADFLRDRETTAGGLSLKDLDLKTHMFRHRCSYMIYSPVFTSLPAEMKQRIFTKLDAALSETAPLPEYNYLPAIEKKAIREIVSATIQKPISH